MMYSEILDYHNVEAGSVPLEDYAQNGGAMSGQ